MANRGEQEEEEVACTSEGDEEEDYESERERRKTEATEAGTRFALLLLGRKKAFRENHVHKT
jgi:hypothetical protein